MYQYQIGCRIAALLFLGAAGAGAGPVRVVATTSIIGDVARAVAGADAEVVDLIPASADPHAFDPTPRDLARLQRADLILANGLGLETFLEKALDAGGARAGGRLRIVNEGRAPRRAAHAFDAAHGHDHEDDPHVWFDPTRVKGWADTIARALAELAPGQATAFQGRAAAYRNALDELDAWIRAEVDRVPPGQRVIATDHDELGYFADRYGVTIVGALLPNVTTVAEISARSRAALQARMRETGARVIVVGHAVNPALAGQLAADIGGRVVPLRTHGLGAPGSPTGSYLDFMRHNVRALMDALAGQTP